jgi:enoyl-CoA hydratase
MGVSTSGHGDGVVEVVMNAPPVNALTVQGWFDLASAVREAGHDLGTRAVVLRAEGCYAAFAAVYECEVPVIAAVHGFCLGGGVGLAGNADVVVASEDAYFGLPEVERGALGAATHLARLVPQHLMRAMVYTGRTVTAAELHAFGSVLEVADRGRLREAALAVAAQIAARDPYVIRRAKESLNGIDPVDVKRSYRFEQGFTFELNLMGAGDRHRNAFISEGAGASTGRTSAGETSAGNVPGGAK